MWYARVVCEILIVAGQLLFDCWGLGVVCEILLVCRGYSVVLVYEIAICNPSHIEERETFRAPDHTFTRRGSTVSALKPISPRGFALSIALHIPAANCAPAPASIFLRCTRRRQDDRGAQASS